MIKTLYSCAFLRLRPQDMDYSQKNRKKVKNNKKNAKKQLTKKPKCSLIDAYFDARIKLTRAFRRKYSFKFKILKKVLKILKKNEKTVDLTILMCYYV